MFNTEEYHEDGDSMFPKILSFYQTTLYHNPEVSILQFFVFLSVFCSRLVRVCNEN